MPPARAGEAPVLLTSGGIRSHVRAIVERIRPATPVLAQAEIHPRARIRTVGHDMSRPMRLKLYRAPRHGRGDGAGSAPSWARTR